jgi:hypothetical protein
VAFRRLDERALFELDENLARSLNALGAEKIKGEAEAHRADLIQRAHPLLRPMLGPSVPEHRKQEIREHIPEALVLLRAEWKSAPELDGRGVEFGEFVAARLRWKVRDLDMAANPQSL